MKIHFVTGNKGKIAAMRQHVAAGFEVEQVTLPLIEPQAASVQEVALVKAAQAFRQLNVPVVVEDSGFFIDALAGFPGPYARYVIETIGAGGILRLAQPLVERTCRFVNALVYMDAADHQQVFLDEGVGELAETVDPTPNAEAWSDLWRIFIPPGETKALVALTDAERKALWQAWGRHSVYGQLANWLRDHR